MSDITYNYEIIAVDEAARCMEVVYTSETHGVMHVGARLPFDGETLEQIISMFSPVQEWRLRALPVVVPEVGTSGQLTDVEFVPEPVVEEPQPLWSAEDEAAFNEQISAETSEPTGG